MICPQTDWLSNSEFLQQFNHRIIQQRVPLTGSIDLTYRCNFRCIHCYIGDRKTFTSDSCKELATDQWLNIIDQFVRAGCLFLLITGGDPLLHPDFCEIYRHAKKKGLIITVFTNGTTLTDRILATFQELPPHQVEITLYGASDETYRAITGQKNILSTCLETVSKLKESNINVGLKTILMTANINEFYLVEQLAADFGVSFRHDSAIFPGFDENNRNVVQLRIPALQAAEIDFAGPERTSEWIHYHERMGSVELDDSLYLCGSGLTTFHITPYGILQPCIMATTVHFDLKSGDFAHGWETVIPRIRQKKRKSSSPCRKCDKIALCGICPPFSLLETGSEDEAPEYLCALGQNRYNLIQEQLHSHETA